MKIVFITIIVVFMQSGFLLEAKAKIGIGSTKKEVIKTYGTPQGTLTDDKSEIFCYLGGIIELKNDKVISIEGNFEKRLIEGRKKRDLEKAQEEKLKDKNAFNEKPIVVYSQGGKTMDIKDVIIPGNVTIVDFYADWCGPCRIISPHLERIAEKDNEVFLRKIDIVNWRTPITKQYNIKSIPRICVYNRHGKMIGEPTSNVARIKEYIKKAKQSY